MSSTETHSPEPGADDLKVPEKVTLRLAPDARLALEWIAAKRGLTLAEVVRQAISHEKFLTEEIDRGSTILVEGKDGRLKQLVFV
ncbi:MULTISPECIES: hypothetical protein [unclassified Bradyrhizobium]|uniref:hypothetical protein n=1 Tax=unclassified Bradyrhizobium TaxID=2631580 RepID=UPI0028E93D9A|nr:MULTISPECIES: hypothetical protein [unclassified Bradyrhizobium]